MKSEQTGDKVEKRKEGDVKEDNFEDFPCL